MKPLDGRWEMYQGMSEEAIRAAYRRKWGREPQEVKQSFEWTVAGPIETGEGTNERANDLQQAWRA